MSDIILQLPLKGPCTTGHIRVRVETRRGARDVDTLMRKICNGIKAYGTAVLLDPSLEATLRAVVHASVETEIVFYAEMNKLHSKPQRLTYRSQYDREMLVEFLRSNREMLVGFGFVRPTGEDGVRTHTIVGEPDFSPESVDDTVDWARMLME